VLLRGVIGVAVVAAIIIVITTRLPAIILQHEWNGRHKA
jgi:hypothetical protein